MELNNLCDFMKLHFEPGMLEYFKHHDDDVFTCISDLYLKEISGKSYQDRITGELNIFVAV